MAAKSHFKDKDMQAVIGWVLRGGVIISMGIVIIGGIIFLYRHGHTIPDYTQFKGVPEFMNNWGGVITGTFALHGRAIIQLGIILLIATPVLRVLFSAIGFLLEKDYLYVGISSLVLIIILISIVTGHAG